VFWLLHLVLLLLWVDKMITASTYYSVYCKATGLITAKGSKKAMMRIIKANPGVYQLAITSRPIGAVFGE
jgi:hypothetical protein